MKGKWSYIILILVFLVGLSLLLYPTFSDWWNTSRQTRAVASYEALIEEADNDELAASKARAIEYNEHLADTGNVWVLSDKRKADYESQLVVEGSDIMGYVEVPSIGCTLPIYHGTDEAVLQIGAGHIEGSSLPVGGTSAHSVLSGHRGLPSAKLFTDLDKLVEGDGFVLRILGETLHYEVDQILVVEPHEVEPLKIVEGEDYCTLVTCTPYSVNTHRLLVRGHRVAETGDASAIVAADAIMIDADIVATCIAAPLLAILFVVAMTTGGKGRTRR